MTEVLHRVLGLTDDEAQAIDTLLGRAPNHLELALYAVMWSEHCSYKSSKAHLARLPTKGPQVLVGPGENAGIVDAGNGVAVAMRIESHNHPSAIEPYQGAATGVGGILRDIFTMGARPVVLMDPLRFGPLSDPRSRWIASGVVAGISGYGNSVGVPTVGGETVFDDCYAGNPLVNVFCAGLLPIDRLVLGAATGEGNLAVLLGASTGRDGIGGVSVLASAGFTDDPAAEEAKRPNVQVGDPFEEKRLIEACLELLEAKLVVGIQDLGGAGLICATSETASRGGVGMDVNLAGVPRREPGMKAWEVMTSESQERMLAIVAPDDMKLLEECCRRWEVRAAVVGRVTSTGRLRVVDGWEGDVLADVPASSLHDDAPLYHRSLTRPADLDARQEDDPAALAPPDDCGADLLSLVMDPAWIYRQYDHQLFLNTVVAPGADAALLRLSAPGVRGSARPTDATGEADAAGAAGAVTRGMAFSTDGNHRWCSLDPRLGTAATVAESTLNLACVGARPVALVNCLNFGNPEHPEVMWQLSEAVDGMAEACEALEVPVVGGNVSLYNESGGVDIDPTPVVATLGLVDDLRDSPPPVALTEGHRIVVIGALSPVSLGGSRWAVQCRGHRGGRLAPLDLGLHGHLLPLVAGLVNDAVVGGVHDVSEGGLGVALAEMALGSGVGFRVGGLPGEAAAHLSMPGESRPHVALFGEGPSRVVVSVAEWRLEELAERCAAADVGWADIGLAVGDRLVVEGVLDLGMAEVRAAAVGVLETLG